MNTTTIDTAGTIVSDPLQETARHAVAVPGQHHQVAAAGPSPGSPTHLLMMAVERGMSLEYLERLIGLQERMEARDAEKAFNQAVADLRGEVIRIEKNQTIKDGPMKGKSYADLQSWVHGVSEALSKHGLSVRWSPLEDSKEWIRIECILRHRSGHKDAASFSGPPDTSGAKNAMQARASTVSYLERYTLKMVLGLAEGGDDDDGNGGPGDAGPKGGARQPPPPPPAEKPAYPGADFEKNLPAWTGVIKSGRKVAEDFIAFAVSRGVPMTSDQQATLRAIKKDEPAKVADEFVDAMDAAERREKGKK